MKAILREIDEIIASAKHERSAIRAKIAESESIFSMGEIVVSQGRAYQITKFLWQNSGSHSVIGKDIKDFRAKPRHIISPYKK